MKSAYLGEKGNYYVSSGGSKVITILHAAEGLWSPIWHTDSLHQFQKTILKV